MELQVPRYGARQMLALRRAIAASSLDHAAFAASTFDIYLEQDAVMVPTTTRSLLLIGIAVLVAVGTCSLTLPLTPTLHLFLTLSLTPTPTPTPTLTLTLTRWHSSRWSCYLCSPWLPPSARALCTCSAGCGSPPPRSTLSRSYRSVR